MSYYFVISPGCEWTPTGDEQRIEWYADGTVICNGIDITDDDFNEENL
jgi:hypothetical protein